MRKFILFMLFLLIFTTAAFGQKSHYDSTEVTVKNDVAFKGVPVNGVVYTYYQGGAVKSEYTYKNGRKEGVGKLYYENGELKSEAPYKNGKREGIARNYDESGALQYEIPFKNDKIEGNMIEYYTGGYTDGSPRVVTPYKAGKKDGIERKYSSQGDNVEISVYKNDKLIKHSENY